MKRLLRAGLSLAFLIATLRPSPAFAQLGATVPNWGVPQTSSGETSRGSYGAMSTQSDIGFGGTALVPVTPCRIVDTRGAVGTFGGPALIAGGPRSFALATGPCTGLPSSIIAYSLNITAVSPGAAGFIKAYPQGASAPVVSTVNFNAGVTTANAAIVPAGTSSGITVVSSANTHLLIDINGYFQGNGSLAPLNPNEYVGWQGDNPGSGIVFGWNTNASGYGLYGYSPHYGVFGISTGAGLSHAGVYGQSTDAIGTFGSSTNTNGMWAQSTNFDALAAFGGRDGGYFQGARHGVIGISTAAAGAGVFGVIGSSSNANSCSAAILGQHGAAVPCIWGFVGPGVYGTSDTDWAILGLSSGATGRGIQGSRVNSTTGSFLTSGVLGYVGTSGVHSFQDVTAGGAKPFVVPYEGRPEKQIVFVSTEADEVLTATRGRIKLDRGLGVIKLPVAFLKVTEAEGWTVQLTPIGETAALAVLKMDPDKGEIVVKGSSSVDVFYRVEGVRRGYKDFSPIQDNVYFVPPSPGAPMDPWPAETKRILIQNKIYNADGMPNLETASALGWTKVWAESAKIAKEAAQKAAAERAAEPQAERPRVEPQ